MSDPTSWKPDGHVWRGWWDLPGWFFLIRDFGFRGALANIRWAHHMRSLNVPSNGDDDGL